MSPNLYVRAAVICTLKPIPRRGSIPALIRMSLEAVLESVFVWMSVWVFRFQ